MLEGGELDRVRRAALKAVRLSEKKIALRDGSTVVYLPVL